jgi:hypothetical protein
MTVVFARPFIAAVCGEIHSNYVLHFTCTEKEDKAVNIRLHTPLLTWTVVVEINSIEGAYFMFGLLCSWIPSYGIKYILF